MNVNVLVDSFGWIEYFAEGPLCGEYAKFIEKASKATYLTPSIVVYEVYKKIKKERGEEKALEAYAYIVDCTTIVALDERLALAAADESLKTGLGLADSIIAACAREKNARIVTSDEHLKGMSNAVFIKKS